MMDTIKHISSHDDQVENYYRFHSHIYDITRWSFLFGRIDLLNLLPDLPPRPRILEVGCGTGKNIETLEYHFPDATIYGVDLSKEMLAKARHKIDQSTKIKLIKARYGSDNLDLEPFDIILLSYSLTMVGDQLDVILQQVLNDLKPHGHVAVVDFHTTPLNWFRRWMKINHVDLDGHLLSLLNKYFHPVTVSVSKAYLGTWSYFKFIGRRA